jgi:hypothetical protein
MTPITVHKLLHIERTPEGPARVEVELSGVPTEGWLLILDNKVRLHPSRLLTNVAVYPEVPSVVLTTKAELTTGNDRTILEWLHDVVAATNEAMDTPA